MLARVLLRRFPVLAIRDFRYLLADRLLAPAAFGFSLVGVPLAVLYATGSTASLSYVLAAQIAPSLVFTQMGGAVAAGLCGAAVGPGWALAVCGFGLVGTAWPLLRIKATAVERPETSSMLTDLREGWSEFRSHTWLWVIVAQFGVILMAWYGAFSVLGPVVAREHLGGPAAWGAITAADALGLIAGGLAALRFTPRRPMLFVVLTGGAVAISPLSLAMVLPLPAICLASFGLGVFVEMMMVQLTVTMARNIPPDKLARVSSYDVLGSVMAMPAGALIAGPLGAAIGADRAQYAAAAVIVIASALALIPRDIRTFRSDEAPRAPAPEETTAALEAA